MMVYYHQILNLFVQYIILIWHNQTIWRYKSTHIIIKKVKITWKENVSQRAKKISRNIALLRRIRAYLPHQTRIIFYKAYIQPHIDYCNTVWVSIYTCAQYPHSSNNGAHNNDGCPKAHPLSPPFWPMWCDAHTKKSPVPNSDHGVSCFSGKKLPLA